MSTFSQSHEFYGFKLAHTVPHTHTHTYKIKKFWFWRHKTFSWKLNFRFPPHHMLYDVLKRNSDLISGKVNSISTKSQFSSPVCITDIYFYIFSFDEEDFHIKKISNINHIRRIVWLKDCFHSFHSLHPHSQALTLLWIAIII